MSAVTAEQVHKRLTLALQPTQLQVIDESADHMGHAGSDGTGHGTHFRVRIALPVPTDGSKPISRVAKHRLVYDALRLELDQGIHALAIESI